MLSLSIDSSRFFNSMWLFIDIFCLCPRVKLTFMEALLERLLLLWLPMWDSEFMVFCFLYKTGWDSWAFCYFLPFSSRGFSFLGNALLSV